MFCRKFVIGAVVVASCAIKSFSAPSIDLISNVSIPAGKSLTLPITATSSNGRPLTYTVTSSTNRISVEVHTNNPFWKLSVVQAAPPNAPGAYQTPFRGTVATVTNVGDMTFMLFRDRAPKAVDVFQGLSMAGYYNSNTIFHRVIPGFMIQGGDPQTNGTGGPVFRYDDEFHSRTIFSGSGQLALANSGKDTCGSQFYITQGPQRFLDFGYTLFGQLLRGNNVLTSVINTSCNTNNNRPFADVIITRASFVTNYTDTVITLTGTNLAGVAGLIRVIADDGTVGGRSTNSFIATTVADAVNDATFLKNPAITNLYLTSGLRVTNYIQAQDLEQNPPFYYVEIADAMTAANALSAEYVAGGFAFTTAVGYSGPLNFNVYVSDNSGFSPYDRQVVTFAVGDTRISAIPTDFIARPMITATNQLLATFTNGVPNSPAGNFTATINWGDNSLSLGQITSNAGRKEVRANHAYINAGHYPITITIQSNLGAQTNVVTTAYVQPALTLIRTGNISALRWPAWATDYQLQMQTNPASPSWMPVTNFPTLSGYEIITTNLSGSGAAFFRLRR